MKKPIMLFFALCIFLVAYTQKVDNQGLKFKYIKLPSTPLDKTIKNSNGVVILVYEEAVIQAKKKAQDDYEKAQAEYPEKVAKAEAEHAARMEKYNIAKEEWDNKSVGKKLLKKTYWKKTTSPLNQSIISHMHRF